VTAELDLVIAGGGPAGMMAGLLFARAGCKVLVLEKHSDFLRDFRGSIPCWRRCSSGGCCRRASSRLDKKLPRTGSSDGFSSRGRRCARLRRQCACSIASRGFAGFRAVQSGWASGAKK
jgi:choline dehydrogenase-like flavoprotein